MELLSVPPSSGQRRGDRGRRMCGLTSITSSTCILLTSLILITLLGMLINEGECQGMVPVSEIIDHKVDKKPAEKPTQGKKLSDQKVKAHMKIASTHLEEQGQEGDSDDEKSARVARKDKPIELQNPEKHASEEFLLTFLLEQYPLSETIEEQVEILQNLENFSHKFENGRDLFKGTKALKEILLPALNSSYPEVRKSACGVFAIASQNNFDVQEAAVDAGVIRHLVHLIAFDKLVRPKSLFALTTLLRNFPKAQGKFIKEGGIPALVKVASYSETRKRSLTLVADLLTERNYCRATRDEEERNKNSSPSSSDADFESLDDDDDDPCDDFKVLETGLKENGWCEVISDSIKNIPGFDIEDQILTSEAVASSLSFCAETIAPYTNIFYHLLGKFQADEDFTSESKLLKDILRVIDPLAKDEL